MRYWIGKSAKPKAELNNFMTIRSSPETLQTSHALTQLLQKWCHLTNAHKHCSSLLLVRCHDQSLSLSQFWVHFPADLKPTLFSLHSLLTVTDLQQIKWTTYQGNKLLITQASIFWVGTHHKSVLWRSFRPYCINRCLGAPKNGKEIHRLLDRKGKECSSCPWKPDDEMLPYALEFSQRNWTW